jgi:hypothetical protein
MKQNYFLKIFIPCSLYHADILIQVNEGITTFFTLVVGCHLNKIMELKCNTCIIFQYLHSPWNLEGYCIALPKPKWNTILAPYCDNILNHIQIRVLQLHFKTLLKSLYHQCGKYCNTLIYIYQHFCMHPLNNSYHL